jgi:hypothetical protein
VLLVAPLVLLAAICFTRPLAPGNPAWEAVAAWLLAVAVAAVAALIWPRAGRRR